MLLVVVGWSGSALPAAADPRIGVSADGRSYAEELPAPLFDPVLRWVPGDVRTETVWIRNDSTEVADLVVELDPGDLRPLLDTGDLELTARVDADPVREVPAATGPLAAVADVAPGGTVVLALTATLSASAGADVMGAGGALGLRIRLTGAAPTPVPDQQAALAATGSPVPVWGALAGAAALGAGAALTARRRTRAGER